MTLSDSGDSLEIRSQDRVHHWIAWVVYGSNEKPVDSINLVGQTQEEAENRARMWAEGLSTKPTT